LFVALYVDDLIFMGSKAKLLEEFKEVIKREFEMTNLGVMKYFLGLEVDHNMTCFFMSQKRYVKELLKKVKMLKCNGLIRLLVPYFISEVHFGPLFFRGSI